MTRRAAPLLIDRLPLYASDADLRASIFGADAGHPAAVVAWRLASRSADFPALTLFGRRYVPAVLEWFEKSAGTAPKSTPPDGNERDNAWNTRKRRGSGSGLDQVPARSRTG